MIASAPREEVSREREGLISVRMRMSGSASTAGEDRDTRSSWWTTSHDHERSWRGSGLFRVRVADKALSQAELGAIVKRMKGNLRTG